MRKLFKNGLSSVITMMFCFCSTNVIHAADFDMTIVVVGDRGVGKTSIIRAISTQGEIISQNDETTKVFCVCPETGRSVNLSLYDINTELETIESSMHSYEYADLFSRIHGALIVFDLSEGLHGPTTLERGRIQRWKDVIKLKSPLCNVSFIQNKEDLILEQKTLERLGMPIAEYAGICERESEIKRGTSQDFSAFPFSNKNEHELQYIMKNIFGTGLRITRQIESLRTKEDAEKCDESSSLISCSTRTSEQDILVLNDFIDELPISEETKKSLYREVLIMKKKGVLPEKIKEEIIKKSKSKCDSKVAIISGCTIMCLAIFTFLGYKYF